MKTQLLIPGEAPRALTWTNRHPNQASRAGVVMYRHSPEVVSGTEFRALRDARGAVIETTHPARIRAALGMDDGEAGVVLIEP